MKDNNISLAEAKVLLPSFFEKPTATGDNFLEKLNPSAETIVQRMQNVQNQSAANPAIN